MGKDNFSTKMIFFLLFSAPQGIHGLLRSGPTQLQGLIWCPLPPDTTSYLQEPDTHEHSQYKSIIREVKAELHFQLEQEQTNNYGEDVDYEPVWGPPEILYVAGESLRRFKERHPRVPLQGLIRNNHLVFRPTSSGKLEITSDEPPFEYKIPPNRGIQTEVARERLESLTTWLSSGERAPRPDWEQLDNKQFELTKPNLDEQDEHRDPIELDFRFQALELTEHQLAMLQPPETRIKSLVYSQFIQRRGRKKARQSRWSSKLSRQFTGKATKTWRNKLAKYGEKHLTETVAPKARLAAKVKVVYVNKKTSKKKGTEKKAVAALEDAPTEAVEASTQRQERREKSRAKQREILSNHWFLKKQVRVVGEGHDEGRVGKVLAVYKVFATEAEGEHIDVEIQAGGSSFFARLGDVQEDSIASEPSPFKLDYRRLKAAKRVELKNTLEGKDGNLWEVPVSQ